MCFWIFKNIYEKETHTENRKKREIYLFIIFHDSKENELYRNQVIFLKTDDSDSIDCYYTLTYVYKPKFKQ